MNFVWQCFLAIALILDWGILSFVLAKRTVAIADARDKGHPKVITDGGEQTVELRKTNASGLNDSSLQEIRALASALKPQECEDWRYAPYGDERGFTYFVWYNGQKADENAHNFYNSNNILEKLKEISRRIWQFIDIRDRWTFVQTWKASDVYAVACRFAKSPLVRYDDFDWKRPYTRWDEGDYVAPIEMDVYDNQHKWYKFEPIVRDTLIVMWATGKDAAYQVLAQDSKNTLTQFTNDLQKAAQNQITMAKAAGVLLGIMELLQDAGKLWNAVDFKAPQWERPKTGGTVDSVDALRKLVYDDYLPSAKQNRKDIRSVLAEFYEVLGTDWARANEATRGKVLWNKSNTLNDIFKRLGRALRSMNRNAQKFHQFASSIL